MMKNYYKDRAAEPRDRRSIPKKRVEKADIMADWLKGLAKLPPSEIVARYGDICKRQSPHTVHAMAVAGMITARMAQ